MVMAINCPSNAHCTHCRHSDECFEPVMTIPATRCRIGQCCATTVVVALLRGTSGSGLLDKPRICLERVEYSSAPRRTHPNLFHLPFSAPLLSSVCVFSLCVHWPISTLNSVPTGSSRTMSTLDDKLLGEKTHYYCSSSEDEDDAPKGSKITTSRTEGGDFLAGSKIRTDFSRKWDNSVNTGPKGVIKDFQRYKQFENEQRETQDKDKLALMKKLSMTCRSFLDEKVDQKLNSDDLADDENDPFIKEYISKRMREMLERYQHREVKKLFGELQFLSDGESFLQIVDDKDLKSVLIVTHVYNRKIPECKLMNSCLDKLAKKYQHVKFCCLDATIAGMSHEFIKFGVPALLVYKNGDLVGNFVSLGDEFGEEFDENDVEDFLVENNILVSSQLISSISYNSNLSSHN